MKLFFAILSLLSLAFAINLEESFEGSCIKPPGMEIDPKALADSDKKWYMTLASNYMNIRYLSAILERPADKMSKRDLEKSCIYATMGSKPIAYSNGKKQKLEIMTTILENWGYLFQLGVKNPMSFSTYPIMTDKEFYYVTINYLDNINIGWGVFSNKKTLDENLKKEILKKIKSFGFNLKRIYELNTNNCK